MHFFWREGLARRKPDHFDALVGVWVDAPSDSAGDHQSGGDQVRESVKINPQLHPSSCVNRKTAPPVQSCELTSGWDKCCKSRCRVLRGNFAFEQFGTYRFGVLDTPQKSNDLRKFHRWRQFVSISMAISHVSD
jgi:hypothetical protein